MWSRQRSGHGVAGTVRREVPAPDVAGDLPASTATRVSRRAGCPVEYQGIEYRLVLLVCPCFSVSVVQMIIIFSFYLHRPAEKCVAKLVQRHIGSIYGSFIPLYFTQDTVMGRAHGCELNIGTENKQTFFTFAIGWARGCERGPALDRHLTRAEKVERNKLF